MGAVIHDEIKQQICDAIVASSTFTGGNARMMLGSVLTTLDHTDNYSTLAAHELAITGYARQATSGWGASSLTADKHAKSEADPVTFHNGSGSNVSGITWWALIDNANTRVIQSGLFPSSVSIDDGEDFVIVPFHTYTGEESAEP